MDFTGIGALTAVLAALGGVVKLVLDALNRADERHNTTLKEMAAQQNDAIKDMQARQEKFLGNHMSALTRSNENVAAVLDELVREVRGGRD